MLQNLDDVASDELRATVAIVGAGPAGLTVAQVLTRRGIDVVVLEAGTGEFRDDVQEEYAGDVVGLPYGNQRLTATRLRMLGGTSNHWTGWCRPLDPEDLEPRDDLGRRGWPITWAELARWYPRAADVVGLTVSPTDVAALPPDVRLPDPVGDLMRPAWLVWRSTRFKDTVAADLAADPTARLVVNAPVVGIRLARDGQRVDHLEIARRPGGEVAVRAEAYVLATGGIHNARLLLASDDVRPEGVGNGNDQVGRTFAEHPHIVVAHARTASGPGAFEAGAITHVSPDERVVGFLAPTPATLRSRRIVTGSVLVDRAQGVGDAPPDRLERGVDRVLAATQGIDDPERGRLVLRCEQLPNPESRVRLVGRRDRLGMRRAALDWRVTADDRRSWMELAEIAADAYGASGRGRVRLRRGRDGRLAPDVAVLGGAHHMGTTAMGADPATSVVDPDCRVHDVADLWIAGSSVFPTTGWSNPTLTIIALALRLATHLAEEVA